MEDDYSNRNADWSSALQPVRRGHLTIHDLHFTQDLAKEWWQSENVPVDRVHVLAKDSMDPGDKNL